MKMNDIPYPIFKTERKSYGSLSSEKFYSTILQGLAPGETYHVHYNSRQDRGTALDFLARRIAKNHKFSREADRSQVFVSFQLPYERVISSKGRDITSCLSDDEKEIVTQRLAWWRFLPRDRVRRVHQSQEVN